jgi:hypothetical protein
MDAKIEEYELKIKERDEINLGKLKGKELEIAELKN